jgi:probable HAF family extracellular repeat protein
MFASRNVGRIVLVAIWMSVWSLAGVVPSLAQGYEIVDLGALLQPAPEGSEAFAINRRGVVVGWARNANTGLQEATRWSLDDGGLTVAERLPDPRCPALPCTVFAADIFAFDINDHGEIVGELAVRSVLETEAVTWNPRESRPLPGNFPYSTSRAINNESVIVGLEYNSILLGNQAAYRLHWDASRDGGISRGASDRVSPRGINDAGDVVGSFLVVVGMPAQPFFYSGDAANGQVPEALPPLPGFDGGLAWAISDRGEVVGYSRNSTTGLRQATIWRRIAGTWQGAALPLAGPGNSEARAINNLGEVVGWSEADGALVWRSGTAEPLLDLLDPADQGAWRLLEARDLNDRGEIVGLGETQGIHGVNGVKQGFLLRPRRAFRIDAIPEGPRRISDAGLVLFPGGIASGIWLTGDRVPGPVSTVPGAAGDLNDGGDLAAQQVLSAVPEAVLLRLASRWLQPEILPRSTPMAAALGLSDGDHAVGLQVHGSHPRLATWDRQGNLNTPPIPPQCEESDGVRINSAGRFVGLCDRDWNISGHNEVPMRHSGPLGFEILPVEDGMNGRAYDVDSRGVAVGWHRQLPPPRLWASDDQAVQWPARSASQSFILAQPLVPDLLRGDGSRSVAFGINDRHEVVGLDHPATGDPYAFLWHQGVAVDLNLLLEGTTGWNLTSAADLNDRGQVIGDGEWTDPQQVKHSSGFVMTLSSQGEDALRLCRGWCGPVGACAEGGEPLWQHPDYADPLARCVNGCLAAVLDPGAPRTLAEAFVVRDCFLFPEEGDLCDGGWKERTEQCCQEAGIGDCGGFYEVPLP